MDGKKLLQERTAMVDNVYRLEHNSRVLTASNIFTWAILDEGYRLNEAFYDYDKLMTVMRNHHERYQFDIYTDVQNRNPQRATAILGGGWTRVDDAKEAINVLDHQVFHDDDFDNFIRDPEEYFYSKVLKRYCKEGITLGELKVAVREYNLFWEHVNQRKEMLWNEHGCLQAFNYFVKSPYEDFWQDHRGMRSTAIDARRNPDKLQAVLDRYFETQTLPSLEAGVKREDYTGYVAPMNIAMLAHNYMNIKQFEKFYLPYFKTIIDTCIKNDRRIYIFVEGSMLRLAEYFQDIPKGYVMLALENDDVVEVRKKLPNLAICGGMSSVLLGHGTKEECVDRAKRLIDEMGDGFILCQDKMMSFRNDAKRENLIAVNEFVRNYQV